MLTCNFEFYGWRNQGNFAKLLNSMEHIATKVNKLFRPAQVQNNRRNSFKKCQISFRRSKWTNPRAPRVVRWWTHWACQQMPDYQLSCRALQLQQAIPARTCSGFRPTRVFHLRLRPQLRVQPLRWWLTKKARQRDVVVEPSRGRNLTTKSS